MGRPRLRQQHGIPYRRGGPFLTKSRSVPITLFVAIALTLALLIFFGAWAVSADIDDQRSLAFGLPGTTPTLTGENLADRGAASQATQLGETAEPVGDNWWSKTLLKACPLH